MRCVWPSCLYQRQLGHYLCQTHRLHVWQGVQDEGAAFHVDRPQAEPAATRLKDHERHGWIYYINVNGRLKIGFAVNVESRLKNYPPGSVVLGRKRGTMADEKAEHARCTPWRVAGREWYELNDSTRRVIDEAITAERQRVRDEARATPLPPRPGYVA